MEKTRSYLACGLWVLASVLMVGGTLDWLRDHDPTSLFWGLYAGLVACVFSGWVIVDHLRRQEDVSLERVIEVVDALHDAKRDVSHLH